MAKIIENQDNNIEAKLRKFEEIMGFSLSDKTKFEYMKIARGLIAGDLPIRSRSRYLQAKSVSKKLREHGIAYIEIPKWQKRGDTRNLEYIQQKLISEEELQNIIAHLPDTDHGRELGLAMKIAFYSGLRLHEILSLDNSKIKVNDHIVINILGKGGKFRKTYLPVTIREDMIGFSKFTISYAYARSTLARVAREAGKYTSFHALRHSCFTRMISKGIPLPQVQKIAGHSNITTTAIYLHFTDEMDENLERLGY